ncbi:MAG: uracil-DNA glycosylase [Planctomycetes bacterium]|nr:uracil-DNA glycosylase [Planctomycetota bacterium]
MGGRTEGLKPKLEPSWLEILGGEFRKDYMLALKRFLLEEKKRFQVYPPGADMFNAFWATPFNSVRVVILGQDPYHGPGQAHGLCFSVRLGVPPPPSLVNIFKEVRSDLGLEPPGHGCLSAWAGRGVFLLNTVLSVREHSPRSHAGKGWETFTDRVISELSARRDHLIFLLWGSPARAKKVLIDSGRHLILESPHPSPPSAYAGFFGCRHFSAANEYLKGLGQPPVDWSLPKEPGETSGTQAVG